MCLMNPMFRIMLIFILTCCSGFTFIPTASFSNAQTEWVIVLPTNDYPFSYVDEQGAPKGFVVDFLSYFSTTHDKTPRFMMTEDSLLEETFINHGDIVFSPSKDLNSDHYYKSRSLMVLDNAVLVRKDSNFNIVINGLSHFLETPHLKIGVKNSNVRMTRIQSFSPHAALKGYANNVDGLNALESGELDVFILPNQQAEILMANQRYRAITLYKTIELTEPYAFTTKNIALSNELNQSITDFFRAPLYKDLYAKHFLKHTPGQFVEKNGLFLFNLIVFFALLSFIYLTYSAFKKNNHLLVQKNSELTRHLESNMRLLDTVLSQEKTLNDYYVNLSHEFRTPLNMILSSSQMGKLVANAPSSKSTQQTITMCSEVVQLNVYRMLKLINNISDLKRLDDHTFPVNPVTVDMVYLVENLVDQINILSTPHTANIQIQSNEPEIFVFTDPMLLTRVIANLISNAIKHGIGPSNRNGHITIHLSSTPEAFEISVVDDGQGIPDAYLDFLFNAYSKPKTSTFNVNEGAGLGLSIVSKIMVTMNGSIHYKTRPKIQGTCFTCLFPLQIDTSKYTSQTNDASGLQEYPIQIEFADVWLKEN